MIVFDTVFVQIIISLPVAVLSTAVTIVAEVLASSKTTLAVRAVIAFAFAVIALVLTMIALAFAVINNLVVGLRVALLEESDRALDDDNAPTFTIVFAIALIDCDVGIRIVLAHENREVEPGRTAANNINFL